MSSVPWSAKGSKGTIVDADQFMILDSEDLAVATTNKRLTFDILQLGIRKLGVQSQTLDMGTNSIRDVAVFSFDDTNTSLTQFSLNIRYDVATGGAHDFRINNISKYTFSATEADFLSNNIINVGDLQFGGIGSPLIRADASNMRFVIGGSDQFQLQIGASIEYSFNSAQMGFLGNDLIQMGKLSFTGLDTSLTQNVLDLQYNVATGGQHVLRVNNISEYTFDASQADFTDNNLVMSGGFIDILEITTPANPATDVGRLFMKDDGFGVTKPFLLDSVGLETDVVGRPLPANTFYVNSEAELQAIFPSSLIDSDVTIFFDSSMTLTDNITITTGVTAEFIAQPNGVTITWSGTGALFKTVDGALGVNSAVQIKYTNFDMIGDGTNQLFDTLTSSSVIFEEINCSNFTSLGIIKALFTNGKESLFVNYSQGLLFLDNFLVDLATVLFQQQTTGLGNPTAFRLFNPTTTGVLKSFDVSLQDLDFSDPFDSVVFLDPNAVATSQFIISDTLVSPSTVNLFQQDPDIAISGVSSPGLDTEFTTVSPHSLSIGDEVTQSGFADSNYNGTFTVVAIVSTTQYQVITTFTATGTGILQNRPIDIDSVADNTSGDAQFTTASAHGLQVNDIVVLSEFTTETTYNGTFIVTAVDTPITGTTFDVAETFVATDTGTLSTKSLDSTNPLVTAKDNPGFKDSMSQSESRSNEALLVSIVTQDVFVNIEDGIPVSGDFIEDPETERFSVDLATGITTYDGLDPATFVVRYSLNIAKDGGGADDYQVALFIDGTQLDKSTTTLLGLTSTSQLVIFTGLVDILPTNTIAIEVRETSGGVADVLVTNLNMLITSA